MFFMFPQLLFLLLLFCGCSNRENVARSHSYNLHYKSLRQRVRPVKSEMCASFRLVDVWYELTIIRYISIFLSLILCFYLDSLMIELICLYEFGGAERFSDWKTYKMPIHTELPRQAIWKQAWKSVFVFVSVRARAYVSVHPSACPYARMRVCTQAVMSVH